MGTHKHVLKWYISEYEHIRDGKIYLLNHFYDLTRGQFMGRLRPSVLCCMADPPKIGHDTSIYDVTFNNFQTACSKNRPEPHIYFGVNHDLINNFWFNPQSWSKEQFNLQAKIWLINLWKYDWLISGTHLICLFCNCIRLECVLFEVQIQRKLCRSLRIEACI